LVPSSWIWARESVLSFGLLLLLLTREGIRHSDRE
jgi:hypothetical protein